ncbi:MAG: tyrosine-type recombinase/integrase [Acidaminococcus intestini]|uniref:Tyrosine-type recombinase/integrase n=1 Tax=Acidaminococcus intestini TaxID=187327 RepID=A0A943EHW4_9FIRM|nr:tyrosine-type recombinase/integrase [Acidaminococcus intestini]
MFTTSKGGPIDIAFANRVLCKLNYKKKLSTHIFRHTHIGLLAERGVPLKAIMARVGHNDPVTTMSIYTHVTDTMSQAAVRAMNAIK